MAPSQTQENKQTRMVQMKKHVKGFQLRPNYSEQRS